ncbi:MAG TPA: hypothetical protein VF121_03140 [Thermoanaerobaculia bacterium]|nr:hypothetical protein [Thermoanaerobaculia bacterium]
MPAKTKEALSRQARFVFVGTVQKLRAANVAEIDDKARTVVVRVDRVEKGPESMAAYVGRDITVKLAPRETVRAGEQARFFTNGWLFAETLAVESLGHEAVVPAGAPRGRRVAAATRPGDARRAVLAASISTAEAASEPAARLKAAAIADRVASADVVVRGRVTAVRVASEERPAPRTSTRRGVTAAATEAPRRKPITEHDPQWREAEIEVDEVEKGGTGKKKVVVRFPGSDDVRWYKAPKFQPGQEGVFILQKAAGEPAARAATRRGRAVAAAAETAAGADTFTALDPDDFQPSERAPEIRALAAATDEPE